MRLATIGLSALLTLQACAKFNGSKASHRTDSGQEQTLEGIHDDCATSESQDPECNSQDAEALTTGLPATCTFTKTAALGTLTCTPRTLPLTRTFAIKGEFDPAKNCSFDQATVTCDIGTNEPLALNLADLSGNERLYDQVPLFITMLKTFLGAKLGDDQNRKTIVFSALDLLEKHRLALFSLGDTKPLLDDVEALIKQVKPDLATDKIAATRTQIESLLADVKTKITNNTLTEPDLVAIAISLSTHLPSEIVGTLDTGTLSLEKILAALGLEPSQTSAP